MEPRMGESDKDREENGPEDMLRRSALLSGSWKVTP
jgi:hypothetical protein